MLTEFSDELCLVEMMATGKILFSELSNSTRKALTAVLEDRKRLVARVAELEKALPAKPPSPPKPPEPEDEVEEFFSDCKRLLNRLDELPERAANFAASVEDKVQDMMQWVEENGTVTEKQRTAVENMAAGVDRWIR